MKRVFSLLIFVIAFTFGTFAQQVTFTAQAPRQMMVGQRFYLQYTINSQEWKGFVSPEIKDFSVLSGPDAMNGFSTFDNNGQVTQTRYTQFSFVLQATKPGTFTIPAASLTVKGNKVQSNTVTISVTGNEQEEQPQKNSDDNANVYIRTSVSNSNPVLGEQIVITYKLYTPTSAIKWDYDFMPDYQNFWAHDLLKGAKQLPQKVEVVNGRKYIVAEIRKTALFPQKTGKITIKSNDIDVQYRIAVKTRNRPANDPFFNSTFANDPFFKSFFEDAFSSFEYQEIKKTLQTNPIEINVRPLPTQGKPVEFNGGIGNFTIKSDYDRNILRAGEALTLKYTISGSGNLNLLEKPVADFPSDFEVYDPKITDNYSSSTSGVSGSRTFEYLIVPRVEGEYTIEPARFAFYSPGEGKYKLIETSGVTVRVFKGNAEISGGGNAKEDIKYTGKDIRYIQNKSLNLYAVGVHFYASWLFYVILLLPFLLFALFIIIWQKKLRDNQNIGLMRNRRATRIATRRLKNAKVLLDQQKQEAFYEEISQAIWGYISDKFNIPLSELSIETAENSLNRKAVDPQITSRFIEALHNCEYARFAPGDKATLMSAIYQETLQVIVKTEEQIGGK